MKDRTLIFLLVTAPFWLTYTIIIAFGLYSISELFWQSIGLPFQDCSSCAIFPSPDMFIKTFLFLIPFVIIFSYTVVLLEKKGIKIKIEKKPEV